MNATARISPQRAQQIIAERLAPKNASPQAVSLGETLVRLRRLSREQVNHILDVQSKNGGAFGRTAIKLDLLKPADLQFALGVQLGFLSETTNPVVIPAALTIARNPYSAAAEQFRVMRTRMMTSIAQEKLNVFSIAGADDTAGVSYVAVNLAASFAQLGRRVLLIDANLRAPSLAKKFGERGASGLANVVEGQVAFEAACRETLLKNLTLLPAGEAIRDPQPVLCSASLKLLLDRAKREFDSVMVLTAPFGKTTDGEFIWSVTGHSLVVVRKDHSRAEDLVRIKSVMRDVGAEIIGSTMTV